MEDFIEKAIKEAQFTLDNGDPDLLKGGRYAGNRNPTEADLKSWRTVLSVAEDHGAIDEPSLKYANAILDRWAKAADTEKTIMADLI